MKSKNQIIWKPILLCGVHTVVIVYFKTLFLIDSDYLRATEQQQILMHLSP